MAEQKRIYLTLNNERREELSEWAEQQGRPVTNLATWLIEKAIDRAKETGEYQPQAKGRYRDIEELIFKNWDKLIDYGRISTDRLKQIKNGEVAPTDLEIARLSAAIGVPEAQIERLINREREPNGA